MEEPPSAPQPNRRRLSSARGLGVGPQTTENPERTSAGSDQEERESSPNDFEEARPRAKRGRPAAAAGRSAAAPQELAGLTMIGTSIPTLMRSSRATGNLSLKQSSFGLSDMKRIQNLQWLNF